MYQNNTTKKYLCVITYNPHDTAKQSFDSCVNVIKLCTVFALCFLHFLSGVFNRKFKDQFILDG